MSIPFGRGASVPRQIRKALCSQWLFSAIEGRKSRILTHAMFEMPLDIQVKMSCGQLNICLKLRRKGKAGYKIFM